MRGVRILVTAGASRLWLGASRSPSKVVFARSLPDPQVARGIAGRAGVLDAIPVEGGWPLRPPAADLGS